MGEFEAELATWYGSDCPAAVVFHASWPDEVIIRGTLTDIAGQVEAAQIKKTAMIIVGPALARDIPVSKLYHRHFSHGYRQADGGSTGDKT
jgi:precorrin-4/cobalt-precorrin-4 C11-methyltransferase